MSSGSLSSAGLCWRVLASAGVPLLLAAQSAACAGQQKPCSPDAECGAGGACVIGRCREATKDVVSSESRRVVLLARKIAVISSRDVPLDGSISRPPVDASITAFGANASGDVVVLLDFDGDVGNGVDVEGAFLVIDPEPGSPGPTASVQIDVAAVLSAWEPASVSWGRTPRLGLPLGAARVPTARRASIRIDVTEAVAKSRSVGHGFALLASGSDPVGARLVTMARSTSGPKLELYLKGP